jgi:hypothetical protein
MRQRRLEQEQERQRLNDELQEAVRRVGGLGMTTRGDVTTRRTKLQGTGWTGSWIGEDGFRTRLELDPVLRFPPERWRKTPEETARITEHVVGNLRGYIPRHEIEERSDKAVREYEENKPRFKLEARDAAVKARLARGETYDMGWSVVGGGRITDRLPELRENPLFADEVFGDRIEGTEEVRLNPRLPGEVPRTSQEDEKTRWERLMGIPTASQEQRDLWTRQARMTDDELNAEWDRWEASNMFAPNPLLQPVRPRPPPKK